MMRNIFVFGLLVFVSCSPRQELQQQSMPPPRSAEVDRAGASMDIASRLRAMTLREKAAQLFIIWMSNRYMPADGDRWKEMERYAREVKVGGFYFSTGGVYEFPVHANKLQAVAATPLLISVDFEWGAGMRIGQATTFPRAMAVAATRDTALAYEMGKAVAREARALGVHQNYSPVVDINNNPKNPVINTRSFGEDPALVSAMARAFIRGTQEMNVIATVKHFPGHGDTEIDTHLDLPSVNFTRARFDSLELVPFKDAIENGVMSVMVAHIHAGAFDASDSVPATASSNITTTLLRGELKFGGMVVTDALAMKGMSKLFSPGEAAVRAVHAGADMLVMSPNTDEAIDSIVAAVRRGIIPEARIDSSVATILRYKQWCGLETNRFVEIEKTAESVGSAEHRDLAMQIARRSVTVAGNESGLLPLTSVNGKKIVDVVFSDTEEKNSAEELHDELVKRKRMELIRIDPRSNQMEYDEAMKKIRAADMILCQFQYHTRSEAMTGFLPKKVVEMMNAILALKKPVIVIATGNPYVVMEFPAPAAALFTYNQSAVSVAAAAEVLFGEQPARGKLPITIPGRYRFGDGAEYPAVTVRAGTAAEAGFDPAALRRADSIIVQAIADSVFPGAVLLVAKNGVIAREQAFGKFTYDADAQRMTVDAIFDLASVTKVISTTSAVMKLVEEKKLSLDDPVVKYFPVFGQNGKEKVTLYNLLVHNSGLQGWRKYYEFCETTECVLDSIFAAPLTYKTGESMIYSDLGLITAGKIVEKVTGRTLAAYVDSAFFTPLKMTSTFYNPPAELRKRVVPTEIDSFWRKTYQPVHGRVHDENATVLGGISGHAGLFSTASDLAKILQMELNGGQYGGRRYLDSTTISRFTARQSDISSRGIGWDTRGEGRSFSGNYSSPKTFLHTGFTGTSVVVDPERSLIVIFLTNRVYPTRNNTKLTSVRPALHNAVYEAIIR